MKAMEILSQFVTSDECKSLIRECPTVIPFALSAFRNARQQADRRTTLFSSRYPGDQFLKLLKNLSAADDDVAERLLAADGLTEISAAVQMDPNGRDAGGLYLYLEVLYGTETLWHILLAENGKHVPRVCKERDLLAGILTNLPLHFLSLPEYQTF